MFKNNCLRKQQSFYFYLFILPMVLGLMIFKIIPIIWGFLLSFFDSRYTISFQKFVGLQNYIYILNDPSFVRSLIIGIAFVIFIVPTTYIVSLFLALLVNKAKAGKGFFRISFFLPTACSYVLASLIWRYSLFNGMFFGFANSILGYFGIQPISWTSELPWIWVVLITARLWLQSGYYMILFLAGLNNIPNQLYEAGKVDGITNSWQEFRYITFPLLKNISIFIILMNVINGFMAFAEFYNILGGAGGTAKYGASSLYQVRPPLVYLYVNSLNSSNFGVGSAGSFIVTSIMLVITLIQNKILGFGQSTRN